MSTLWTVWSENAKASPDAEAIVHWVAGEEPLRQSRGELLQAAEVAAEKLRVAGVARGEVCALILRHDPRFYALAMGVVRLGALPAVLAYPNPRLHPDKFRQGLEGMARKSGLDWILTERDLDPLVRPLVSGSESKVRGALFPFELEARRPLEPYGAAPGGPCLLQHSSGTTGLQKAVVLSHEAVLGHIERYAEAIGLTPGDKVVSWLPLYHDMGLIAAFHLPLATGVPSVQIDPFEWVSAPSLFLEAISRERGTLGWLPNFAYNLMADRVHEEELEGVSLESLRLLVNCSEPVRAESHEKFFRRFAPRGLARKALGASYAMAETTFAVTQTVPGAEAKVLVVDRDELAEGRVRLTSGAGRRCVSSGRPIRDCQISVQGGEVGELAIHSASLFSGYRNDPEKTREVLLGDLYLSGDLGFLHEGECYVVGRKKEIVIVAGKNIHPGDVEDALLGVAGLIPGRAVAFGREDDASGTEQLCLVAETAYTEASERKALRRLVVEACMQIAVTVARVYLVPPRWLWKSSSGKPSRKQNGERALAEEEWLT